MIIKPVKINYYCSSLSKKIKQIPSKVYSKNLLNMALTGLAILGTSCVVPSCVNNDEMELNTYVSQCPRVETPIKNLSGLIEKTDYMMNLLDLLPPGKSITDLKSINVVKENGDSANLFLTSVDDSFIKMDYFIKKSDGTECSSKCQIYNADYGQTTLMVFPANGIDYRYIRYTQSRADLNSVHESLMGDTRKHNSIITKSGKALLRLKDDGTKEYLNVNTHF